MQLLHMVLKQPGPSLCRSVHKEQVHTAGRYHAPEVAGVS
jgi:hypothetical protein